MRKMKPAQKKRVSRPKNVRKAYRKTGPDRIEDAIRDMERLYRFNTWAG